MAKSTFFAVHHATPFLLTFALFPAKSIHTTTNQSGVEMAAQPDYLRNPPPIYPEISRPAKEEGTVWLNTHVDIKGRAIMIEISKSSGYFRLDQASREAVKRWRFKPAPADIFFVKSSVEIRSCHYFQN